MRSYEKRVHNMCEPMPMNSTDFLLWTAPVPLFPNKTPRCQDKDKNVIGPLPSFTFSFVLNSFCLQMTKMKKNDPLYILSLTGHRLYQRNE